jgi:hypothetical protein
VLPLRPYKAVVARGMTRHLAYLHIPENPRQS